ncbi:MAG TPA: mechanosensitive ion channel family protein [Stellaceae bacterium]|nr:mechanosensitive ion channel family protein [Stellaceae bacterium]
MDSNLSQSNRSACARRVPWRRGCLACGFVLVVLLSLGQAAPSFGQSTSAAAPQAAPQWRTTPAPTDPNAAGSMLASNASKLEQAAEALIADLEPIVAAVPRLPGELGAFAARAVDPAQGLFTWWLGKLVVTFALALGLQALVGRLPIGARARVDLSPGRQLSFGAIAGLLARDALGVLAVAAVAFTARGLWFGVASMRTEIAVPLIAALVYWRALLLPVDFVLRPNVTPARLVDVTDIAARRLRQLAIWMLGLQVFSIAVLRALFHAGLAFTVVQLVAIVIGIGNAIVALAFIRRERRAEKTEARTIVVTIHRPAHRILTWVWHPAAILFVVVALLTWLIGIVTRDTTFFWGVIETTGIVIGLWALETIIALWSERAEPMQAGNGGTPTRWPPLIRRCLLIGIWFIAAAAVSRLWLVERSHLLTVERWDEYVGAALSIAVTLFGAYVLAHAVLIHTEHRLNPTPVDPDEAPLVNAPMPIASRLQTMLPLLRLFVVATIGVVAVLIALSALGINTTSLIAGASIFGLAISFGSQALVRDIVSGIFFMADDAFRIGEYIDTGKLRGTVEGMSIRSLRLRHQNGQVHVIPFGHIEQVTNFSRDWTTTKFNLRLVHGSDLEKVRKTVKQIGAEMMADPEIAPEIIQPLKLQGITEIDPGAVIIRLKFTARPTQPTFVYRRALLLIYTRFKEKGIEFASNSVIVQTSAPPGAATGSIDLAAAAGGATTLITPPPTP